MESINEIFNWLSEHESGFSALAALVVIIGVTLSPLGAGFRALFSGDKNVDKKEIKPALTGNRVNKQTNKQNTEMAVPATQDFLESPPPLITDKPSIAVLPFVNMTDDKSQEYFADGMTEDIITGLSCDSRLFVIARNSTFAYKGQSPDIRTVGKELGVSYVLEGSIRPVGERLRITVQLIETTSGAHVWADKIDRPVAEIFDIMDDVVDGLVTSLCSNLGVAEGKRALRQQPGNLEAWELCLRAEMVWMGRRATDGVIEAQTLTKKATEIEPGYALGWAMLSYTSSLPIPYLLTRDIVKTTEQVDEFINKAETLAPGDPAVLGYIGYAAAICGNANTGIDYLERSLDLNPNNALFRRFYSLTLMYASLLDEALTQIDLFFRQSPKDPDLGGGYFTRSLIQVLQDKCVEAEKSATLAIKYQPASPLFYLARALALTGLDQNDIAKDEMERSRQLAPHFTLTKIEEWWRLSFQKEDAEKLINLVRQAW